jgi:hypothetical protein
MYRHRYSSNILFFEIIFFPSGVPRKRGGGRLRIVFILDSCKYGSFANCSYATIRRRVIEGGFKHYRAAKKQFMIEIQRETTLNFTKNYFEMDRSYWDLVMFSDEKTFRSNQENKKICNIFFPLAFVSTSYGR